MCVTIYQIIGYLVSAKKIHFKKNKIDKFNELLKDYRTWCLTDEKTIFIIKQNESICECGDENGNGREF